MYGFVADKEYLIDPDGINNGVEPFVVNCNMEKGKVLLPYLQNSKRNSLTNPFTELSSLHLHAILMIIM